MNYHTDHHDMHNVIVCSMLFEYAEMHMHTLYVLHILWYGNDGDSVYTRSLLGALDLMESGHII